MGKIGAVVGTVLAGAVVAGGVAMAVPESRNWILDEVAKVSNIHKKVVSENDDLKLALDELKTQLQTEKETVVVLTGQRTELLNTVTALDNQINSTTDATTIETLQTKKAEILGQVESLNTQLATAQARIDSLQARVDELESKQSEYTVSPVLREVIYNDTTFSFVNHERYEYLAGADDSVIWENFNVTRIRYNTRYFIYDTDGNEIINQADSYKLLYPGENFTSSLKILDATGRVVTLDELNTGISYPYVISFEKTLLSDGSIGNVDITLQLDDVISLVSEQTATLISGEELNSAIGTEVTAVTFDRYTDSEQQTYVVDGVNVIDGISPVSVSTSDSVGSANLYMVDNKAYILSKDKIVANSDMCGAFYNCGSLTNFNLTNFDTSNVTDMSYMFCCSGLTTLDLSNFDTSNVTNMSYMFSYCPGLTTLDLSSFDTSNVTDMNTMFTGCAGLTTLDLSNFDTSNVTDMNGMFNGCAGLTALDVSNFDTSNVTDMNTMFTGCAGLTTLDLSNFDTSNVTLMYFMFNGCAGLTTIYVGDGWVVDNVATSNDMFRGSSNLPNFDENVIDKTNAYVGGYLTSKTQSAETVTE